MTTCRLAAGEEMNLDERCLYLVKRGRINRLCMEDIYERIDGGDFFGEETAIFKKHHSYAFRAEEESELYVLPGDAIADIPVVRWKMMETHERRATFAGCRLDY